SPERFVARRNTKLITQPIKGTNRRLADTEANIQQQHLLRESQKERSENVMIVDLMRNDLAKICLPSSVLVDELFGVYAFRHVNQMISTISGKTEKPINIVTAMDALFPMGSMTGAPKVSALQLIDRYESFTRGLYSGTVGYIDPSGDWDFNVVIRSLVYDMTTQRASISAGGAITALSDPVGEYEESILKMESILTLLQEMS
ncbi:MAG TPA: chorismate-binding protein, partial [Saprospiraceae bacterium]|nr:chorismate-binding protein [Saprospiraceae bacterium]